MKMLKSFGLLLCAAVTGVLAGEETVATVARRSIFPGLPKHVITVGAGGQYPNLTVALNDTSSDVFYLHAGNYTGQTLITRPNIIIYGETFTPFLSYLGNRVTLSVNMPASIAVSNDKSGTLQIHAKNISLYHLDIENTYGLPVSQSQAIALSVQSDLFACYFCNLKGAQDTLLANTGLQVYSSSRIAGSVDFIFGMRASVWITRSLIESNGPGYLTASGRNASDPYWYVIDKSIVKGNAPNQTYLGRPWRASARVVYQKTYLGDNIKPEGWSLWNPGEPRTEYILFGEYQNYGPGAWNASTRAPFATLHNAAVAIETVLNTNYPAWVNTLFV
jgi:pectinesterase